MTTPQVTVLRSPEFNGLQIQVQFPEENVEYTLRITEERMALTSTTTGSIGSLLAEVTQKLSVELRTRFYQEGFEAGAKESVVKVQKAMPPNFAKVFQYGVKVGIARMKRRAFQFVKRCLEENEIVLDMKKLPRDMRYDPRYALEEEAVEARERRLHAEWPPGPTEYETASGTFGGSAQVNLNLPPAQPGQVLHFPNTPGGEIPNPRAGQTVWVSPQDAINTDLENSDNTDLRIESAPDSGDLTIALDARNDQPVRIGNAPAGTRELQCDGSAWHEVESGAENVRNQMQRSILEGERREAQGRAEEQLRAGLAEEQEQLSAIAMRGPVPGALTSLGVGILNQARNFFNPAGRTRRQQEEERVESGRRIRMREIINRANTHNPPTQER